MITIDSDYIALQFFSFFNNFDVMFLYLLLLQLNYSRDASNGNKLDELGKWLQTNNPQSDADPQHVDAGTLFTRYTAYRS
jgi:hypothetical protein